MSRAEKFIQEYTRNCSNELDSFQTKTGAWVDTYHEWLTPDDALSAVAIAREETIKDVCEWIEKNVYSYTWCDFQQHERGIEKGKLIDDLKQAMLIKC